MQRRSKFGCLVKIRRRMVGDKRFFVRHDIIGQRRCCRRRSVTVRKRRVRIEILAQRYGRKIHPHSVDQRRHSDNQIALLALDRRFGVFLRAIGGNRDAGERERLAASVFQRSALRGKIVFARAQARQNVAFNLFVFILLGSLVA